MTPVDAHVMDRTIPRYKGSVAERSLQKGYELGLVHLAGCKSKLRMLDPPPSLNIGDPDVVWGVREYHKGLFATHQPIEIAFGSRVTAMYAVSTENPDIAGTRDCNLFDGGRDVSWIRLLHAMIDYQGIDLSRLEASQGEVPIQ